MKYKGLYRICIKSKGKNVPTCERVELYTEHGNLIDNFGNSYYGLPFFIDSLPCAKRIEFKGAKV